MVHVNFDWNGSNTQFVETFDKILVKLGYTLNNPNNQTLEEKGVLVSTKEWIRNNEKKGNLHFYTGSPQKIKSGNGFRLRMALYGYPIFDTYSYGRYQDPLSNALMEIQLTLPATIYLAKRDKFALHWTIRCVNDSDYITLCTNFKSLWQEEELGKYKRVESDKKFTIRFVKQQLYIHATLLLSMVKETKDWQEQIDEDSIKTFESQIKGILPECNIIPFHFY